MSRKLIMVFSVMCALLVPTVALSGSTNVPGHQSSKYDTDGNGIPDEGVVVTGKYTSLYAVDASGAYYWDLGDGRIQTSTGVSSVEDLDESTLTICDYQVQYRGTFENDPFMDTGWIKNQINCKGEEKGTFNSTIVSESDPRYTGNPEYAVWGNWEYSRDTVSGTGNLVRPEHHVDS